jgi:hypothetical protein
MPTLTEQMKFRQEKKKNNKGLTKVATQCSASTSAVN